MSDPYILGTRGSALALTQSTLAAEHIVQMFNAHSREHGAERTLSFDITTVKTDGDVLTARKPRRHRSLRRRTAPAPSRR